MSEKTSKVKESYQQALMELEGLGYQSHPILGMRMLRRIIDVEWDEEISEEEVKLWKGAAAQKLGEVFFHGIPDVIEQDRLRAHYYFIMSWSCENNDSFYYLAVLYKMLGEYRHAARYFKDVIKEGLSMREEAVVQLEELRKEGYDVGNPSEIKYPELEDEELNVI